jgi:L-gulonolactone oxidase
LISFDPVTRLVHAEAGISLAALLDFLLPRGFFLPVTPGTRFVTLGGAIANDVHGKNHHEAGTFGCWVREITLARSDGSEVTVRTEDESGLFNATIGGLGLTGLITCALFEVLPVANNMVDVETIPFGNLKEFFAIAAESEASWQYTVSWIDCFADHGVGRGLFSRARHSAKGANFTTRRKSSVAVPVEAPNFMLATPTMRLFNALYYKIGKHKAGALRTECYLPYFYPLDAIRRWNLLYGKDGMYQYQSVVPPEAAIAATEEMLKLIAVAQQGSFLAVLKTFGVKTSPGILSFPREGTTLALDFPNRGTSTLALLTQLDHVVRAAGGRLYPAKDGRLPPDMFRLGYPHLDEFVNHIDPKFSSAFWRRMQG